MSVRNYPVAQALYLKYCRDHNWETLRDIYVQEDDYNAQAACFIRESYDPKVIVFRYNHISLLCVCMHAEFVPSSVCQMKYFCLGRTGFRKQVMSQCKPQERQ